MSGYTVINILDMVETVGEDELSSILSDFSCPRNPEIEHFIHNNAIEFAKRKMSITHLVFDGDAGFWMQLHEEMRQAGFYLKTVEDTCEHFAKIDREIVWYGSMNLLAKTKIEDSIMRVQSKKIAAELMELTFGKDS